MEEFSEQDFMDMMASLAGAIGWIAATTNEGNNQTSKFTRDHLAQCARFIRQHCPDKDGGAQ